MCGLPNGSPHIHIVMIIHLFRGKCNNTAKRFKARMPPIRRAKVIYGGKGHKIGNILQFLYRNKACRI